MRRNTVLALSTVVVMAVVAALLIVLTRGGDDAIAGVSVSGGDVPKSTVDQPVEVPHAPQTRGRRVDAEDLRERGIGAGDPAVGVGKCHAHGHAGQ